MGKLPKPKAIAELVVAHSWGLIRAETWDIYIYTLLPRVRW